MNDTLKTLVRRTLKELGDEAPARLGIKKATLDGYIKRGKYSLDFIEKILKAQPPEQEQGYPEPTPEQPVQGYEDPRHPPDYVPAPSLVSPNFVPPPPQPVWPQPQPQPVPQPTQPVEAQVNEIVRYIQGTVDHFLNQFADRISNLERAVSAIRQAHLRDVQMRAGLASSLARPDQGVPVEQVFTTNPSGIMGTPLGMGNALDTGRAPTKEAVDAQANDVIIEGVHMRGAELARPATFIPNQPAFGYGWNRPRPPRN